MSHTRTAPLPARLWVYQSERFPVVSHGLLVAALVIGGMGYATAGGNWPGVGRMVGVFGVVLGAFALLRIADEFKDAADDAAHRPYRPVPRGLVTLGELAGVGVAIAALQLAVSWWLDPTLIGYLIAFWGLWALMSREFFVPVWLKAHPLAYMLAHMMVLPVMMLYLLAAARPLSAGSVVGPAAFLAASYANGIVFEIGRKLRAPEDEEAGVETYSMLWGVPRAAGAWAAAVVLAAGFAGVAAGDVQVAGRFLPIAGLGIAGAVWAARQMGRTPTHANSRWIEHGSALWVLGCYLGLGLLPHL
jgi:4-hydroxybenzoate polyprenyltransferase